MSDLLGRVSEAMTEAGLKWLSDQGHGAQWGPWGEIPTEVFARASIKVIQEDELQGVCAGSFFLLYEAWATGGDLEKAFRDVTLEAAEEAKYMMELNAMCSGEMFGHKEPSNGK